MRSLLFAIAVALAAAYSAAAFEPKPGHYIGKDYFGRVLISFRLMANGEIHNLHQNGVFIAEHAGTLHSHGTYAFARRNGTLEFHTLAHWSNATHCSGHFSTVSTLPPPAHTLAFSMFQAHWTED